MDECVLEVIYVQTRYIDMQKREAPLTSGLTTCTALRYTLYTIHNIRYTDTHCTQFIQYTLYTIQMHNIHNIHNILKNTEHVHNTLLHSVKALEPTSEQIDTADTK